MASATIPSPTVRGITVPISEDDLLVLAAGELLSNCSLQDNTAQEAATLNPAVFIRPVRRNALANLFENLDPETIQHLAACGGTPLLG